MDKELLTISAAAKFLSISRPTFNKIRSEKKIPEIRVGKRLKFRKKDLIGFLNSSQEQVVIPPQAYFKDVSLDIFSKKGVNILEVRKNIFDLRNIKQLDPYGLMSLLTTIIAKSRNGEKIQLIVEDNYSCRYLQYVNFFSEIERECGGNVIWDRSLLQRLQFIDTDLLLPIISIRNPGGERKVAEELIKLLKKQGFSEEIGGYIGWILGELADNTFQHSHAIPSERICFILARRFLLGNSNCIIVGIADLGLGIHSTLKSNTKYASLKDARALIEAFKPHVSSWDDSYGRGKGLTDVVKIAMGNNSYFRVSSGGNGFFMDFRNKNAPKIERMKPLTEISGTRYGLVLIDTNFFDLSRKKIDNFLKEEIERLRI